MSSDAPANEGQFSCSSMVLRCCEWLDNTWLGKLVRTVDTCVSRTLLYRALMALICLQPPLDLLTDLQQIWFFSRERWWLSLAVSTSVWYASVRFGFIYAATQARPAPFRRIVVLYVPGLLLPFWDILTKTYTIDTRTTAGATQRGGARRSSSMPPRGRAESQSIGAPPSAETDYHEASCEDDIEQPRENAGERQLLTRDTHGPIEDEEMDDMPRKVGDEVKEEQPCLAKPPLQLEIRDTPFNGSRVPQKTYNVIMAFVCKYKALKDHPRVSYNDFCLNPFSAMAIPVLFALILLFLPLYMLEAMCTKITRRRARRDARRDMYPKEPKESSSVIVKFLINFTFEMWLVLPAMLLGPYLLVCASATLARESLMLGERKDFEKHKHYSRVIIFIEGVLESTPQLMLQSITYWLAVKSGNTEPFFGISYNFMFTVSAAFSVAGILKAAWSFYRNNKQIITMLPPPTRKEEVLSTVRRNGMALISADFSLKKDKEVVLAAVRQNGLALKVADAELKKDEEVVLAAVGQNGLALKFADAKWKKDEKVVLIALRQDGRALCFADATLKKKDKEVVVLAAVRQNGLALIFAGAEWKKDEKVVRAALQQDGKALYFADAELKKDKDVVLVAIKQDWRALEFVDADLKTNKEVILAVLQRGRRAPELGDAKLKRDEEFRVIARRQEGKAPELSEAKLKKDKDFVLAALRQNCLAALEFADAELSKDKEIILAAVQQDGRALEFAGAKLKKDVDVVLAAVQHDGQALKFADIKLKKDKEIVLAAVRQDGRAFEFAGTRLKQDEDVVAAVQ